MKIHCIACGKFISELCESGSFQMSSLGVVQVGCVCGAKMDWKFPSVISGNEFAINMHVCKTKKKQKAVVEE